MALFREMYCGLCHTLAGRYGAAARWVLNYDFTFLAILLSGRSGGTAPRRCAVHPLRPRRVREPDPAMEMAADESVILAWWQLRDGAADRGTVRGLPWAGAAALLGAGYEKASALRPEFSGAVRRQLDALHQLEERRSPSMDEAADTFAVLLRQAAEGVEEPVRRRVLEQILYHVGRWVYLIDAADDLKRDAASGDYNPVALRYGLSGGVWTEEARRDFAVTLDHSVHQITTAFELWDFGEFRPVLETAFYSGLFQVGRAVLDGTFRRGRSPVRQGSVRQGK